MQRTGVHNRDRQVAPKPDSSLSSRPPTVGTDVPHSPARTLGPSVVGSTATSKGSQEETAGGTRPDQRCGLVHSPPPVTGPNTPPSRGYLALVVNELRTAGARPPHGREVELGSPYNQYKCSWLICLHLDTCAGGGDPPRTVVQLQAMRQSGFPLRFVLDLRADPDTHRVPHKVKTPSMSVHPRTRTCGWSGVAS